MFDRLLERMIEYFDCRCICPFPWTENLQTFEEAGRDRAVKVPGVAGVAKWIAVVELAEVIKLVEVVETFEMFELATSPPGSSNGRSNRSE
jgi:hypothetical protein